MNDLEGLKYHLCHAAEKMGATVVDARFNQFLPYGVSGVVVIQESHLTIHTWPEYGYAAIDIFTCGAIKLDAGVQYLQTKLKAQKAEYQMIRRGLNLKFREEMINDK